MKADKEKSLHSRYNPQGEAERYIGSLSLNEKTRFFILIEPGLGYMSAPLRKRVPSAKIIALHLEKPKRPKAERPDSQWYPETGIPLQDFLEAEIPGSKASEIQFVEWRPALSVYGGAYLALVEEAAEFIKRVDANERTLKAFGRSWFRNFFKNLDIIKTVICPAPLSLPLVVTGAGPGLEDAIPLIREEHRQGRLFILAVSSSVAALETREIIPDLVITTDGSTWAKFHLYETFRVKGACPLAAALTAALPSQTETFPVLPISDGSFWQTLILRELNIPFITLPQRGTVSASALDLAFGLSNNVIYIAGMDLANRDIRSHARPYSFDRFIEENAVKMNSVYSQTYKRSSLLKAGGSYSIYASWFKKQLGFYPKRLYSLGKNNPVFGSLKTALQSAAKTESDSAGKVLGNFKTIAYNNGDCHSGKAYSLLKKALKDPAHLEPLRKELVPLLLEGEERSPGSPFNELDDKLSDELINTVHSLVRRREKDG